MELQEKYRELLFRMNQSDEKAFDEFYELSLPKAKNFVEKKS